MAEERDLDRVEKGFAAVDNSIINGNEEGLNSTDEQFIREVEEGLSADELYDPNEPILTKYSDMPTYVSERLSQQIKLLSAYDINNRNIDEFKYSSRGLQEGMETLRHMSLLSLSTLNEVELELKKNAGSVFYKEVYKDLLEQSIEISKNLDNRDMLTSLATQERLTFISMAVEDKEPMKAIISDALDYENNKVNPETLMVFANLQFKRGLTDDDMKHVVALEMLKEKVQSKEVELDSSQISELGQILTQVEEFKETFDDTSRGNYDYFKEALTGLAFDDVANNRNLLKKAIHNETYAPNPDAPGFWEKASSQNENSVQIVAEWNKRFEEKLLEKSAAIYKTQEKISSKLPFANKVDMANSSLLGSSVIKRDAYGNPESTYYNVSPLTKTMHFTRGGASDPDTYILAALNARKNNWSKVTLNHGGSHQEAIMFMENSIKALVDEGGYTYDQIIVPKKYANILEKLRDETPSISEVPLEGKEEEYTNLADYDTEKTKTDSEELSAAKGLEINKKEEEEFDVHNQEEVIPQEQMEQEQEDIPQEQMEYIPQEQMEYIPQEQMEYDLQEQMEYNPQEQMEYNPQEQRRQEVEPDMVQFESDEFNGELPEKKKPAGDGDYIDYETPEGIDLNNAQTSNKKVNEAKTKSKRPEYKKPK